MITFAVYGTPQPSGSKTIGYRHTGFPFVRDANPKSKKWKRIVSETSASYMKDNGLGIMHGPLTVSIVFHLIRPKSHFRKEGLSKKAPMFPSVRPDVLKLARAVEDACTGTIWNDDAQIVEETIAKYYGASSRVEISVKEALPCPQ